ncbi:sulfotransferase [Poseidonocella sp. HB161398]|uniref:sulfotransferase n=1 Tax=Poseidonocella sp. HB161398 TaxID=2320855 RepID=UPI0011091FB7|nr:sulfotransferase [Poseidonocella sp. HB161398]
MVISVTYILGSTRSGTSALRNALAETKYVGFGEGHLVPILEDIFSDVARHKEKGLGAGVPGNGLHNLKKNVLLRCIVHGYERYLQGELGSACVMDKTPTIVPIRLSPLLNEFHESPKFLHCARRHVDNVQSKVKKFPDRTLEQHCQEWAHCNLKWLEVRDQLSGNFFDFDFYDLSNDPGRISKDIGEYLQLDDVEITKMAEYLRSQRPQSHAKRDLTKYLKLSEMTWTDDEKDAFIRICGPVGKRLGYGFEEYWEQNELSVENKVEQGL